MARGLAVVAAIAIALFACGDKREPQRDPPRPTQPRGVDPLASLHLPDQPIDWTKPIAKHARDLTGYAGSAACKPCHAKEYASYERHSMARTGMRPIGSVDQAWIGKIFDAATPVTHTRSGFRYTPVRHGGNYAVTETLLDASGAAVASWDEPITHVFSAGSYGLAFYSERGGKLIHLPIDYYAKAARWDLDPMAFGGNPRIGVQLDIYCISCHSDEPAQRFADPLPPGIGCERCHGPSKQHIASLRPEDTFGPKQHPSARRQLEVCAQCHQSTFPVLREGRDHFDFHPGEQLDAMRVNFLADPAEQDRVKLLDHAERLVRSACWRGANKSGEGPTRSSAEGGAKVDDKTMTCTTCHDPHTSSLEKDAAWWDGKCLQCHDRTACTDTKVHRDAAGDHCTPCHMRSGPTSNVPLVAVTDHWIQKRPPPIKPGPTEPPRSIVAWSMHLGEPVADGGTSALAHADAGLTDEATRLAVAAIAKQPSAQLYDFVANAYLARRHTREAGLAYRAALGLDPDDTGALFGYARVMLDAKQPAEAQHAFERMLQLDPDDVAALETLGIDRYRNGERAKAVELFRRAATTGRASGIAYVGLALDARGDARQELAWLEKAWRAEPRDRWILDELDAVAGTIGDPKLVTETARRRAAITPVAGSVASAWIPVQNRRQ